MTVSTNTDVIHDLERLLVSCADGVEGYRHAACDVDAVPLRRFLFHAAAAREEIASVLTNTLVSLGYKPTHHGSLAGALHRRWIDAIGALQGSGEHAVLRECQRGEQETIAAFAATLRGELPEDVRTIIQAQLGRVFQATAALNRLTCDLEEGPLPCDDVTLEWSGPCSLSEDAHARR